MLNISPEFFIPEFTVEVIVPRYWVDESFFSDADPLEDAATVRGIFSNNPLNPMFGTAGVNNSNPILLLLTADIPNPREGDSITINGQPYTIGTPRPNLSGITHIDLVAEM